MKPFFLFLGMVLAVTLTVGRAGPRSSLRSRLKSAIQRAQATASYRRLGRKCVHPRVAPASKRDLWLVKTLGVQPHPQSAGQVHRLVAKCYGLPSGYVALTVSPVLHETPDDVENLYLTRFRVHPLLRRLGIGSALMDAVLACAGHDGFHEVFAEALHSDAYLEDVYLHFGFARSADYKQTGGPAGAWSLWRRELSWS